MTAPIVLFVYNRPWHTEQTLNALMQNELADQSVLYIYADGPQSNSTEEQLKNINEVRQIIRAKKWCKEVHIIEAEKNKGLADSIVEGVTDVVNQYGKVVVLEDDIVTSEGFLKYMNDALDLYENEESVFHISGYMYPHKETLPETFFFNVPLCWGWATWKRAWTFYNSNARQLIDYFDTNANWPGFNKFGDTYLENQLRANQTGKLKSWFIKWHGSVMIQKGYCLFPRKSLVNNTGFDSTGIHNGTTDKFSHAHLAKNIFIRAIPLEESQSAEKIIKNFYRKVIHQSSYTAKQKLKKVVLGLLPFKNLAKKIVTKTIERAFPEMQIFKDRNDNLSLIKSEESNTVLGNHTKIYGPYHLLNVQIGDFSYVAPNAYISYTVIGKFCSIGTNLLCGWGIHPTNGLSTAPMFYSTMKQNGMTLSETDKIVERKQITIGNDVFIGANVTILDGIEIGDGAVIGAGAVVSKNIPPYAIAVGNPIQIIKFRFEEKQIESLLKIKWWDWDSEKLKLVSASFYDIDGFIKMNSAGI